MICRGDRQEAEGDAVPAEDSSGWRAEDGEGEDGSWKEGCGGGEG